MKIALTTLMVLFSFNALATGSFSCTGKFKTGSDQFDIHVSGATSHMEGSPLLDKVIVHVATQPDQHFEVPKERVVGYWSNDNFFLINIIDSDFNNSEVKINYNTEYKKGIMKVNLPGILATTKKVSCLFE